MRRFHLKQLSVLVTALLMLSACQSVSNQMQSEPDPQHQSKAQPAPQTTEHTVSKDAQHDTAFDLLSQHSTSVEIAVRTLSPNPTTRMAMPVSAWRLPEYAPAPYNERYLHTDDNPVQSTANQPISTFSVDVDTGSYSNTRRILNEGRLPPADAVRHEEFVNYFSYHYPQPTDHRPFAVHTSLIASPYKSGAQLLHIAIKGKETTTQDLPPANLVLLVDVSGSMSSQMTLVKQTLRQLVPQLRAVDKVSLITYASGERLIMPATNMTDMGKQTLLEHINALRASGSTAGEQAIQLAYKQAQDGYISDGINRILLLTDGDFNVGISDFETLKSMVAEKRKSGISLSTFGYGAGNYNERLMEQLADAGDGNYSYIDSRQEAQKVLNRQLSSTLATIAQDVKIQVEFNPNTVSEYRLIGYQNRLLNEEDFKNDNVDAGDIGAGHAVTAIYEIIPTGVTGYLADRRYTANTARNTQQSSEYAQVAVRYKLPNQTNSVEMSQVVPRGRAVALRNASDDVRFAVAVASFAEILRGGKYAGSMNYDSVIELAKSAQGADKDGTRAEFVELVEIAKSLATKPSTKDSK